MTLKDTCKCMKDLLMCIAEDMDKAEVGNKAAAQRVRTCSIKFEKAAKAFRKESVKAEKSGVFKKAKKSAKKKPAAKKAAKPKKVAKKKPVKKAVKRARPAPKKRATAKVPKSKAAKKRR